MCSRGGLDRDRRFPPRLGPRDLRPGSERGSINAEHALQPSNTVRQPGHCSACRASETLSEKSQSVSLESLRLLHAWTCAVAAIPRNPRGFVGAATLCGAALFPYIPLPQSKFHRTYLSHCTDYCVQIRASIRYANRIGHSETLRITHNTVP